MARKIYQFDYIKDERPMASWRSGSAFQKGVPIVKLTIYGPPTTSFYINDSITPIVIGTSGVFNIDLKNQTKITSLFFDFDCLNNLQESDNIVVNAIYNI